MSRASAQIRAVLFGDESAKLANLTPETDLFSTAVVWIRTKTVQRFFRVSRLLAGLGAGRSTATGGTAPLSRPLDKYNLQVNTCQLVYNSARCDCRAGLESGDLFSSARVGKRSKKTRTNK